jgi:hypothetical protein
MGILEGNCPYKDSQRGIPYKEPRRGITDKGIPKGTTLTRIPKGGIPYILLIPIGIP